MFNEVAVFIIEIDVIKFIYSEKATKFCEISTLLLTGIWVLNAATQGKQQPCVQWYQIKAKPCWALTTQFICMLTGSKLGTTAGHIYLGVIFVKGFDLRYVKIVS